jgi:hypothetical protein
MIHLFVNLEGNEKGCITSGYGRISRKKNAGGHIAKVANLFDRADRSYEKDDNSHETLGRSYEKSK